MKKRYRVEIRWLGSWHQVDTNNTLFKAGGTHWGRGEGELPLQYLSPSPYATPRRLGPLSIYLQERVPDTGEFFTWLIHTATAHAHNTPLLYLALYLVD